MKNSRCPYCGPNTYRPLPDYFGKLSPLDDYGIFVIPGRKEGNLMAVNSDRDGLQGVNRTLYTTMKALADERYDGNANRAKGINIITTNNTFDELEQMYDPKIMSRFLPGDADHVITFEGLDDMRGKGH